MNKISAAIIMIIALCCALSTTVFAHVPHDVVQDLKLSPSFSHDRTIFAIIYWSLFKSTDGGYNWYRQAKGICPHEPMALAISPAFSLDKTLFVSCIKGEIYRSQNAGRSWSLVRSNTDITGDNNCFVHLSISPQFGTDHTVLALNSTGSIYQTVDGGENWKQVFQKELEITAVDWIANRIILGTSLGEIYVSKDSGRYWEKYGQIPTRQKITCIKLPSGSMSPEPFFIGTEQDGVLRVLNDCRTFENASNGLPEKHITALDYLYERGRPILLACTWTEALFYSEDNGASWKKNEAGLLKNHQAIEYLQPHFSKIAVSDTGEIFLGGFCGIFKSSYKAGSWFKLETLYNYILGLGISPSTTIGYAVSVNTYGGGMYTTTDGGSSWEINNRGLINSRLGPIAYSPDYATDRTVFTGTYDNILKSTDGGQHWTSIPVIPSMISFGGLKIIFRNRVRKLIFKYNLSRLGKLLSLLKIDIRELPRSTIGIAISPGFATDQTFFASISYGGLLRSLDGGFSFSQVWDDSKGNVSSLIISPVFPSDRTLFLSPTDGGIYRSCDGSETWQQVGADRDFGKMVLDISPNYNLDQTLFAGGDNGLFRSCDKGETWEKVRINAQEENEPVSAVAFSPFFATDRQFMVQIKRGDLFLCHDYGDRLEAVASTSGESGFEFSQLLGRDSTPLIKFSPDYNKDKTVYAASMSQLMKSTNSGISWSEIKRPCRYEAESSLLGWLVAPVFLEGQWSKENDKEYSSSTTIYSSNKDNQVTLKFVGNGIKWLGTHGPDRGTASVFIDGEFQTKVDQYSKQKAFLAESFSVTGISYGCHTITISVDGLKNISSTGERIDIDAFDVSR